MIAGGTIADFAVGGANAVSVLGNLEGSPVELRRGSDESGDDAGFADAAGVSADDDEGHGLYTAYRRVAECTIYEGRCTK